MHQEPGLKWLFMDLNSYFASVEQQERPELRGKPVAVVPMMTDSTCAIAASYEAKAYGIKTGTPIYEAKQMCPGLRCVLARHDLYVDYHHRILEEVVRHTPINKVWSIDELSSRLPPGKRTPERAAEVARKIKEGLWKNVGEAINCSIGVAPNSLLAKIAADMQKPDGLVMLRQEELPGRLLDLKLTDMPGIGYNMDKRLRRAGITDMRGLWNTSPKHARKIWGGVQGERFWYWLHGYDFENPETGNVMIGHSRVLDPDLRRPDKARLMARRLLVKATYRLRRKGFFASHLSLSVRTTDGFRWANEAKISHARDPFTFLQLLDSMWASLSHEFPVASGVKFKKISVILSGLKTADQITGSLFETASPEAIRQTHRREALAGALDKLQNKYQKETVWLGVIPKTSAGHVGTKIAFSRVPDREEFWN
ncbi:MAG TPA: impB/mucB/samB family protein [Alphaproteobacteria bacterium]|nr:impB/mucB/samB family protein [Micavibrio sp.]MBK9563371.1 impB/mucB/samB family protein [Micavibrio sp.]HQX27033.1 impB/mucB/samB family protein [Alphaproteobacteria bacterium]